MAKRAPEQSELVHQFTPDIVEESSLDKTNDYPGQLFEEENLRHLLLIYKQLGEIAQRDATKWRRRYQRLLLEVKTKTNIHILNGRRNGTHRKTIQTFVNGIPKQPNKSTQ